MAMSAIGTNTAVNPLGAMGHVIASQIPAMHTLAATASPDVIESRLKGVVRGRGASGTRFETPLVLQRPMGGIAQHGLARLSFAATFDAYKAGAEAWEGYDLLLDGQLAARMTFSHHIDAPDNGMFSQWMISQADLFLPFVNVPAVSAVLRRSEDDVCKTAMCRIGFENGSSHLVALSKVAFRGQRMLFSSVEYTCLEFSAEVNADLSRIVSTPLATALQLSFNDVILATLPCSGGMTLVKGDTFHAVIET
jgi:hypothetical protein